MKRVSIIITILILTGCVTVGCKLNETMIPSVKPDNELSDIVLNRDSSSTPKNNITSINGQLIEEEKSCSSLYDSELIDLPSRTRWGIDEVNFYIHDVTPEGGVGALYEYEITSWYGITMSFGSNMHEYPTITQLDGEILRLDIVSGTNYREIQYFDLNNQFTSEVFFVPSIYTDYLDLYNEQYLVAFFDFLDYPERCETVLKIVNIFDGSVIAEIDRGFAYLTSAAETLILISDKEVYVEYFSASDYGSDSRVLCREIISFQHTDNPILFITDFTD